MSKGNTMPTTLISANSTDGGLDIVYVDDKIFFRYADTNLLSYFEYDSGSSGWVEADPKPTLVANSDF